MSIHNFVDATEEKPQELYATRDRFGKRHNLTDTTGQPVVKRVWNAVMAVFFLVAAVSPAFAEDPNAPAPQDPAVKAEKASKLNTKVESEEHTLFKQDKHEPEYDPLVFYKDETKKIGINKKGRANLSMPW